MAPHFFRTYERVINYSHTLARREYRGLGFRSPVDLALGKDGVIYVVSRAEEISAGSGGIRIVMLNIKEEYLGDFGQYGEGDGEFRWPTSVAVDSQQNVYVSDELLHRISIFDPRGKFLSRWDVPQPEGAEPSGPTSLAFDKNDNLYVVDGTNHHVGVFTEQGKLLHQFGSQGDGPGQFNMPWGITLDGQGNVWLADWRNDRIQKLTAEGKFLASVGSSGDLAGQFNRPTNIAVDHDGDVFVTDWMNHRVQAFTPELRYSTSLVGDATFSPWALQKLEPNAGVMRQLGMVRDLSPLQRFLYPVAVEVDPESRILVLETGFNRIQVYQKQLEAAVR